MWRSIGTLPRPSSPRRWTESRDERISPAMTGKALPSIALLALAACQPAAERKAAEPASSESAVEPPAAPSPDEGGDLIVSPEQLAGEYRVAGVGGHGIDLPYAITASITADTIHLTADC